MKLRCAVWRPHRMNVWYYGLRSFLCAWLFTNMANKWMLMACCGPLEPDNFPCLNMNVFYYDNLFCLWPVNLIRYFVAIYSILWMLCELLPCWCVVWLKFLYSLVPRCSLKQIVPVYSRCTVLFLLRNRMVQAEDTSYSWLHADLWHILLFLLLIYLMNSEVWFIFASTMPMICWYS